MEPQLATTRDTQPELGRDCSATGCTRHGFAAAAPRFGRWSELPGEKSSTYRTKGLFFEHGNFDSSAGPAKPGRPTGPATSRTKGGALVVVGARESRAHGEGGQ
jgi:hypothetical protein